MNKSVYFAGIDPGETGGLGIIDAAGRYVAAHRWNEKEPVKLHNILYYIKDMVEVVYIEDVRIFPRETKGFITSNQGLLVSSGIWQGFMISLRIAYTLIPMATWQSAVGLHHWQARLKVNPAQHTPLTLARHHWPQAPLEYQADDGKAVGLLLASLSLRDSRAGIDRGALQAQAQVKAKVKKAQLRKARKAQKDLASDIGW